MRKQALHLQKMQPRPFTLNRKLYEFLQSQPSQEWAKCTLHPLILSPFQRTLTSASYWDALASGITVLITSPVWDDSGWKMLEAWSSQEVLLHLSGTQPGDRFWLGASLTLSKEEHLSCFCAQAFFHIKEQVKINQKGIWCEQLDLIQERLDSRVPKRQTHIALWALDHSSIFPPVLGQSKIKIKFSE